MLKRWHIALGVVLTLSLLWPLIVAPYFSHDDNVHTMRIYEMHQCLRDGQIPCRWVPDLGGGFGYPEFNYYAPLPYYVGELFYLATQDIIVAAKLTFALGFVLPFLLTYLCASSLWGKLGGSVSAIFFIFAPYHALNMYHRGALGELWATAFLPLVFWAFLRLVNHPSSWHSLLLGVALALVILSHNLTAMLVLAVVATLSVAQIWVYKEGGFAKYLILGGIWAFALSACYVVPVVFEAGLVHLETITLDEYNYSQHFQGFRQLFFEKPWWVPGAGEVAHQVGTTHLLAWAIGLTAACALWRKNTQLRSIAATCSALIVACIFMMTPASAWIWDRVAVLSFLQFPWRLLSLVSFATSILAGASLLLARSDRERVLIWTAMVALVVVMNVGWFQPDRFLNVTQAQLLTDGGWDNLRMFAIWDFLPKSAQVAPEQPASAASQLLSGEADVTDVESGSNWLTFNASSQTGATIQINRYDFPTWEIAIDGRSVSYGHDSSSGLLKVSVPAGAHRIAARLRDTPVRTASNIVSALALVVCAVICLGSLFVRQRRLELARQELIFAGEA